MRAAEVDVRNKHSMAYRLSHPLFFIRMPWKECVMHIPRNTHSRSASACCFLPFLVAIEFASVKFSSSFIYSFESIESTWQSLRSYSSVWSLITLVEISDRWSSFSTKFILYECNFGFCIPCYVHSLSADPWNWDSVSDWRFGQAHRLEKLRKRNVTRYWNSVQLFGKNK